MIIAHRGASSYAPENTLASIRKAFDLNADGVEIDVQMSRDGELVLQHDWTLEKIAGEKKLVTSADLAELKKIDAGSWFSESFKGEQIPLLSEALAAIPDGRLVNIEIKKRADDHRNLEEKIAELLNDMNMKERVIISSFNHKSIIKISEIDSSLKTALILSNLMVDPHEYFKKFSCYSIHPVVYFIEPELIKIIHDLGMKVITWTVDIPDLAQLLLKIGCDSIITNYPDLLAQPS